MRHTNAEEIFTTDLVSDRVALRCASCREPCLYQQAANIFFPKHGDICTAIEFRCGNCHHLSVLEIEQRGGSTFLATHVK